MTQAFGGLHITGGSANFNALNAGSELGSSVGWAAIAASSHGNLSVVAAPATGRLTVQPGIYKVDLDLTIEGNYSSGQSGDALGVVVAGIRKGGTLVAGTKSKTQLITEGLPMPVHVSAIIEVSQDDLEDGLNFISSQLAGVDASGNDVVITEGRLLAVRLS